MNTLTYGRTEYAVEKLTVPDDGVGFAYMLRGPRGSEYALMRNIPNPRMLFAVNARKFTGSTPFTWVRESADGLTLKVVS